MKILLTGSAGFIGNHMALRLLAEGHRVESIDNVNSYYDPKLKEARLKRIESAKGAERHSLHRIDLADKAAVDDVFSSFKPDVVVHLAAQAGVRYSLESPQTYVDSNVTGFLNILEGCRHNPVKHLIYASTSSVYGANRKMPFKESEATSHQLSFYAATKKANEAMAHSYSALFGIPTTGLRFFTVYGPWGRPDMALFKFTECMLKGKPIDVFNFGKHKRDFTYVDDIVESIVRLVEKAPVANEGWDAFAPDPSSSFAPYRICNIGNSAPVDLSAYIEAIEDVLGVKAERNLLPLQKGDVPDTWADSSALESITGFRPRTSVKDGVRRFVEWYREYYRA